MKYKHKKNSRKNDLQNRIIKRQIDEIDDLKKTIAALETDCDKKDEIINSVDSLRNELIEIVNELRQKEKEYDDLITELKTMRSIVNKEAFNGKWSIVKFLIR